MNAGHVHEASKLVLELDPDGSGWFVCESCPLAFKTDLSGRVVRERARSSLSGLEKENGTQ